MSRQKIDYGIDLGTTNSSVAKMEKGSPVVIKDFKYQKDIIRSCVAFHKKKKIYAGNDAINRYNKESLKAVKEFNKADENTYQRNSFIEFKRTMGTEAKYKSSYMGKEYTSEELSAELLKTLRNNVKNYNDEDIFAAVITVPAKFRQSQIDATQRAAELAGFKHCILLQEPIAASMAYGLDSEEIDGYWIVFDFGGGTFDVALMNVEEGIMKVVDTEGDNHLGGKNIDFAIVDDILLPWIQEKYVLKNEEAIKLFREPLKMYAERAKKELSTEKKAEILTDDPIGVDEEGNEVELDLTITLDEFNNVAVPIFQRAVDLTKELLGENNMKPGELETIILIGGPTQSQTLRNMLKEEITEKINTRVNPMTAVTRGATLFAATEDIPGDLQERDTSKIQLRLKYPETTVETQEIVGVTIEREKCEGEVPEDIYIEIIRSDKGWTSGKTKIEDDSEIIKLQLKSGETNNYEIMLYDDKGNKLDCEPDNFTIINGFNPANATLPCNVGIEIIDTSSAKPKNILAPIKGLEKNQSLPAKGKGTFKTQQDIRPGKKEDRINIPIYEGKPGTKAITNEYVNRVIITGEDLPQFLPAGSEVEITLNIDSSRRIKFEAFFPYIDETIEIEIDVSENIQKAPEADELTQNIEREKHRVHMMKESGLISETKAQEFLSTLEEISDLFKNTDDIDTRVQAKDRLNQIIQEVDKLEEQAQWPNMEKRLEEAFEHAKTANDRFGDEKSAKVLEELRREYDEVLDKRNVNVAKDLERKLGGFVFSVQSKHVGFWITIIKSIDDNFSVHNWKNKTEARRLLDEAKRIIATNPNKEQLSSIVQALFNQMVDPSRAKVPTGIGKSGKEILTK